MTLLQQIVDSVTGSTLPLQFRQTRIKLTAFVIVFLSLLLILSGLNVSQTTQRGFEAEQVVRDERNVQQQEELIQEIDRLNLALQQQEALANRANREVDQRRQIRNVDSRRSQNLESVQLSILINNIAILALLSFLTWIGLYFLLLPLARAVEAKEKFITLASHELRTPLAILYSEMSLSQDEGDKKVLKKIHTEALVEIKRLQKLSDTLLGRDHSGKILISIENLIREVWQSLQPINDKNLTLLVTGQGAITTNLTMFTQVIYNLLENTIKHGTGKANVEVEIDTEGKVTIKNKTDLKSYKKGVGLQNIQQMATEIGARIEQNIEGDWFFSTIVFGNI